MAAAGVRGDCQDAAEGDVCAQQEWSGRIVGVACGGLYPRDERGLLDADAVQWEDDLLRCTVVCLRRLAVYGGRDSLWLRRLHFCDSALGTKHERTAATLNGLAEAQGQYAEAETQCARVLAIKWATHGRDQIPHVPQRTIEPESCGRISARRARSRDAPPPMTADLAAGRRR